MDELASLDQSARETALERFQIIQPTPETAPPRPDDLTLQRLHIDIRHPGWVELLLKRLKLDLVYRAEL